MAKNKYNAKKVWVDGYKFHSKAEARRYLELKLLLRAGAIRNLELQKKFELIPRQDGERAVNYYADFYYEEAFQGGWRAVCEDVKGMKTDVYKLKKKLLLYKEGIRIREIHTSNG